MLSLCSPKKYSAHSHLITTADFEAARAQRVFPGEELLLAGVGIVSVADLNLHVFHVDGVLDKIQIRDARGLLEVGLPRAEIAVAHILAQRHIEEHGLLAHVT